ncbi:MAG TPA: hypothetical protein VGB52_12275 [Actinomycetota bacterium]
MDGATLRLLETIRGAASVPSPPKNALEAFTCLLHGTPTPALSTVERLWVEVTAGDAEAQRWPRAEAFRAIFAGELAQEKLTERRVAQGMLAIEGLLALPRAERAALALTCVLGFTEGEVAHVLEVEPQAAGEIIEQAVASVRHAARTTTGTLRRGGAAA